MSKSKYEAGDRFKVLVDTSIFRVGKVVVLKELWGSTSGGGYFVLEDGATDKSIRFSKAFSNLEYIGPVALPDTSAVSFRSTLNRTIIDVPFSLTDMQKELVKSMLGYCKP